MAVSRSRAESHAHRMRDTKRFGCHICAASAQVCETLDRRAGMQESHMWEPPPPPEGDEAAGEADGDSDPQAGAAWEELPAEQRLGEVLEHLRRRHAYCLFCGCQVPHALLSMLLPCSARAACRSPCTHRPATPHHVPVRSIETRTTWQRLALENGKMITDRYQGFVTATCDHVALLHYSIAGKYISSLQPWTATHVVCHAHVGMVPPTTQLAHRYNAGHKGDVPV